MKTQDHTAIRLRLRDLAQLFNSMDPSPFVDRDLDADAEDVQSHAERWALLAGDLPLLEMSVEWARRGRAAHRTERARFLESMGDHRSARQLLGHAVTGMP